MQNVWVFCLRTCHEDTVGMAESGRLLSPEGTVDGRHNQCSWQTASTGPHVVHRLLGCCDKQLISQGKQQDRSVRMRYLGAFNDLVPYVPHCRFA